MLWQKYFVFLECLLDEEFSTTEMKLKNQHTEQGQQNKTLHTRSNKRHYSTKNRKFWGKGKRWTLESKQSSFPQCPLQYHQSLIIRLLTSLAGKVRECSKRKTPNVSMVSSGNHEAAALRQNPSCKQAWKIEQSKCLPLAPLGLQAKCAHSWWSHGKCRCNLFSPHS